MNMRRWLPSPIRRQFKLMLRWLNDFRSGDLRRFSNNQISVNQYPFQLSLSQEIKRNQSHAEKLHNLRLATNKINNLQLEPKAMFSFWKEIGSPSKQRGFKKARNIIQNHITTDYGGGLCQLSGIIYHAALKANMQIVERHHHSRDIYTDETRFTPLGSDATVVYGYKDLRWVNSYPFPVILQFEVLDDELKICITAPQELTISKISFKSTNHNGLISVITTNEQGDEIAVSEYRVESI